MGIRGSEWLILLLIVLLLFGARRLPGAARSLGQSLRIFKKELSSQASEGDTTGTPGSAPGRSDASPDSPDSPPNSP